MIKNIIVDVLSYRVWWAILISTSEKQLSISLKRKNIKQWNYK